MHLFAAMLILAGTLLLLKLLNTRAGCIAISVLVGIIALFFFIWLHNDSYHAPAQVSQAVCHEPNLWAGLTDADGVTIEPKYVEVPCPSRAPAAAMRAEGSSDPYQKSLQALTGEKLTPLN